MNAVMRETNLYMSDVCIPSEENIFPEIQKDQKVKYPLRRNSEASAEAT